MKNLLLYAKYFAIQEKKETITEEHLKQAFVDSHVDDQDMRKTIEELLATKGGTNTQSYIDTKYIEEASSHGKMKFSDSLKKFITSMKEKGYSTKETKIETRDSREGVPVIIETTEELYDHHAKQLISLGSIKEKLNSIIFDQEIAIEAVKDTVSRAIFEEREDAVKAILFFVGPPATGKTFLSEETGKILEEFGYKTKVFNMTMYSDDSSNLTGLAQSWQGAGKGDLTKYIEENPKSLIIFDEIEKCHQKQQRNLFRLLDRGYIEDKYDNSIVKANDCILIFTSNLGKNIYDRSDYTSMIRNQKETETLLLESIAKEKSEYNKDILAITPPLTSRLSASKIVLFNKVGMKAYFNMSKQEIERYFGVIKNKFGISLECKNEAIIASLLTYLPFFDPRRIKGKIGDDLFDSLRDYIQHNSIDISKYNKISIEVSSELQELLDQNFIEDINKLEFNDARFQELIDKKETLFIVPSFEIVGDTIKYILTKPDIQKVKNIQDFDGDVKVELDIPSGKIEGEPNANIFGHDNAKKMLVRISSKIQKFQDLRRQNNPEASEVLKNIPKGILLYGPPGTGKTKIARAFAAQVECPIIVASGKDMTTDQYVGTGIKKIKEIFQKARDFAPSVLFIDEIDAIGTRSNSENAQENNKNINTLLEELDGFSKDEYKPVFIIAATNRKDTIDPAIIRGGRIEEHIEIGPLDKDARAAFIAYMFENDDSFSKDIDVEKFLKYTLGMSGADLEQVFKKARYNIEIIREEKEDSSILIDLEMLIEVVNEVRYGAVNETRADAKFENMLTAYHEAGHAIVSLALNPSLTINQVTIISRADFGGFVSYNPEDVHRYDKKFFIGRIASAYAGRVAEEAYFVKNDQDIEHGISAGASGDIEQATKTIRRAVLELGMDEKLGLINYEGDLSESTKQKIDETVLRWQEEIKELCRVTIDNNWENIVKLATKLEESEMLDGSWLSENIKVKI
ncbi:AAA family ATPase [Sulfurimonas aquatica]|uniref:AAA family ATPase n=1 Tax=Sulfurimonas aquatica TaxID=2672570 RepID=A0A975B0X1_9BACT|nr:AAA family ATPase [Sulfurimonas aquatica]QSZ42196.1 AAA family ATPase [Sulfurimonas aquatica]